MATERVQKILARAGYGSRRSCEKFIETGRVTVNGKTITLGDKADPHSDEICLDGSKIKSSLKFSYIAVYKPRGVLSAVSNTYGLENITDLVPIEIPLHPVGRLDLDSEGLVFLTNDGDLTNQLTHPRYGHEKEYRVLLAQHPADRQLDSWRRGAILEDGYKTAAAQVRMIKSHGKGAWVRVIMKEGRKRQIRETAKSLGLFVVKLIRVRIGTLLLGNLKPRAWRHLTDNEIDLLKGKPASKTKSNRARRKPTSRKNYPKRRNKKNQRR